MKLKKIGLAIILASLIILSSMPLAEAGIFNSASQIVNLVGASGSSGIIPLSSFRRVMPDGSTTPFVIPSNRVFLVTKIFVVIASGQTVPKAQFQMAPFYYRNLSIANGFGDKVVDIESGFPLAVWSSNFNVKVVNMANNYSTVPGILQCRIVGLLAPPEAVGAPIDLLLLFD
jgi:hypothetical protein